MASFVTNDKAVVIELACVLNGDAHINELSDFMTPYGLLVSMNLSDNILRMVHDSESIEQLMDLRYNLRYRPTDGKAGAAIYLYLDWNARAWLLFVYESRVVFKRCMQAKKPYYFTNNCDPMTITGVNETFTEETTLAEAGNRAIEITGEPFGQTTTIVYSEWIKQKPQGAMNLPTFPSLLSKKEEK